MKKTLLIIFVFIFTYSGKCQNYQSLFGQDSTTWTILKEIIDGAYTDYFQTLTGFDSTLNGHDYKKVYNFQMTGLIREDTITGKAWYYSFNSQSERIIMDLSLQLNDTFMIYTSWQDSIPAVADSIYFINGLKHIRFDIGIFGLMSMSKLEFIEGAGPNAGITYQGETEGWNYISEQLLCKYTDSIQVYANTDFNGQCFVNITGIPEYSNQLHSTAFPNPVRRNDWLNFKNEQDPIQSIKLYDMSGNILCRSTESQIKISEPAGIYFVELIRNSGNQDRLKVIVID